MLLLEDTRQVAKKHDTKHNYFRSVGIHWNRTALYCGDYTLPTDQSICIDTKKDIQELIGDIQVKQMAKRDIREKIDDIVFKFNLPINPFSHDIYRTICDDDTERFAEKEINKLCYQNNVPEGVIKEFQNLYVKRHGFFHRGLKRAQNSKIKLIILVDNKDGVTDISDLFRWQNPRLNIWKNSDEITGYRKNGKPIYKKILKYPRATTGQTLAKACLTMQEKYKCMFLFTTPEEAGKRIISILNMNSEV